MSAEGATSESTNTHVTIALTVKQRLADLQQRQWFRIVSEILQLREGREERNMPGICKDDIRDCQEDFVPDVEGKGGREGNREKEGCDLVSIATMLIKLTGERSQAGERILGQMR